MDPHHAFSCSECQMCFATSQQLALHNYKIHGTRAQEWQYIQSDVCPGCLKTFTHPFGCVSTCATDITDVGNESMGCVNQLNQ
jgi:hypothetical protein